MKEGVSQIIDILRNDSAHFLIVGGNVFDTVFALRDNNEPHQSFLDFFTDITQIKYPNFVVYDLHSGVQALRADQDTKILLGLAEQKEAKEKNQKRIIDDGLKDILQEAIAKRKNTDERMERALPPHAAFKRFDQLLTRENAKRTVLVIDYADALLAESGTTGADREQAALKIALHKWSRDEKIHKKGHLILLICRHIEELGQEVLDRCGCLAATRLSKPNEDERAVFLRHREFARQTSDILAKITAGLSYKEIGKALAQMNAESNIDDLVNACFMAKKQVLRDEYGDLLEIVQPQVGFDAVGGLEQVIQKLKGVASAMRAGKTSLAPQGILFMGPPGTGKTLVAEAFAREAGVNFIRPLDIKSKWVGESEKRMSRFVNALRDMAPVIVFIDEFDQNQSERGGFDGDSGTSRNLFKKLLEVMSDVSLRGKVLWIFATNRPDLIDPAMKRPGRCDLHIPFLPPDVKRLEEICRKTPKQYPDIISKIKDYGEYAERCLGLNGADMVEIVRRAWDHANELGREKIAAEDMDWACDDYRPQINDRTQIAFMTLLAITECSSKSLLPANIDQVAIDCYKQIVGALPTAVNMNEIISAAMAHGRDRNQMN